MAKANTTSKAKSDAASMMDDGEGAESIETMPETTAAPVVTATKTEDAPGPVATIAPASGDPRKDMIDAFHEEIAEVEEQIARLPDYSERMAKYRADFDAALAKKKADDERNHRALSALTQENQALATLGSERAMNEDDLNQKLRRLKAEMARLGG